MKSKDVYAFRNKKNDVHLEFSFVNDGHAKRKKTDFIELLREAIATLEGETGPRRVESIANHRT